MEPNPSQEPPCNTLEAEPLAISATEPIPTAAIPVVLLADVEPETEEPQCPAPGCDYCVGYCWEGSCPFFAGYPEPNYTDRELEMLAKTVWGEAAGCSPDEWRLVIWTVFQRVDSEHRDFRNQNTIEAVLTAPNQFAGYNESFSVDPDIYEVVAEEAAKWFAGEAPPTHEIYAPTLPYLFFDGDGKNNWFREAWR